MLFSQKSVPDELRKRRINVCIPRLVFVHWFGENKKRLSINFGVVSVENFSVRER